jgi:ATP synthase protein I
VGLGLGFAADAVLKTTPWGIIIGVLVGFAVSVWMTVRSAQRISAELAKETGPAADLPFEDDEED